MRRAENECVFGRLRTLLEVLEVSLTCNMLRLIQQNSAGAKMGHLPLIITFMTVFIRRAPVEDNTA